MTGTPEGSTESGFMEKPGIEPATPGLQGILRLVNRGPLFLTVHDQLVICLCLIYMIPILNFKSFSSFSYLHNMTLNLI